MLPAELELKSLQVMVIRYAQPEDLEALIKLISSLKKLIVQEGGQKVLVLMQEMKTQ